MKKFLGNNLPEKTSYRSIRVSKRERTVEVLREKGETTDLKIREFTFHRVNTH